MEGVQPMPLGFPFKPKVKSERDVDIRRVFYFLFFYLGALTCLICTQV